MIWGANANINAARFPTKFPRTKPTAASVPSSVDPAAARTLTLKDSTVAAIHWLLPRKRRYQSSVKPCGGNARYDVAVTEVAAMISTGEIKRKSINVTIACNAIE